jgi:hypothetical protein
MLALFCGSRDWEDVNEIIHGLNMAWAIAEREFFATRYDELTILHGDAPGADTIAGEQAAKIGFLVHAEPADWKTYGNHAGPIRNRKMIDMRPDYVFAFMARAGSRGTQDVINEANRRRIPIITRRPT